MSGFDFNSVFVSGNLTSDPELRSLASGTSVCKLRLAHNDRRKNSATGEYEDRPGYYDIIVWAGLAEYVARNLVKGNKVAVAGRLQWREWETQDGTKRSTVEIVAQTCMPVPKGTTTEPAPEYAGVTSGTSDDDIPF